MQDAPDREVRGRLAMKWPLAAARSLPQDAVSSRLAVVFVLFLVVFVVAVVLR
jgi:hypothetical protein